MLSLQGANLRVTNDQLPLFDDSIGALDGPVFIEDWTAWEDDRRQRVPAGDGDDGRGEQGHRQAASGSSNSSNGARGDRHESQAGLTLGNTPERTNRVSLRADAVITAIKNQPQTLSSDCIQHGPTPWHPELTAPPNFD